MGVLFLATSLVGGTLYFVYETARLEDAKDFAKSLAASASENVSNHAREVEDFLWSKLAFDGFFSQNQLSATTVYAQQKTARDLAFQLSAVQAPILEYYLENEAGHSLSFSVTGELVTLPSALAPVIATEKNKSRQLWGAAQWRVIPSRSDLVYLSRAIFDPETTAYAGFFLALVPLAFFDAMVADLVQEDAGIILQDRGERIGHDDLKEVLLGDGRERSASFDTNGSTVYYSTGYDQRDRWGVAVLISRNLVLDNLSAARALVALVAAVCFLFALALSYLQSRSVTRSLESLTQSIQAVAGGDLAVTIPVEGGREVAALARNFNAMVGRLDEMLRDLSQERGAKQEAELRSLEAEYRNLQAQLNPHFLYNALETINSLAKLEKVPRIATLVSALGVLLRGALGQAEQTVTLSRELDYLRSYLLFLQTALGSDLHVEIDVPARWGGHSVPKFLLQPLVENSLRHGYPDGVTNAKIRVVVSEGETGTWEIQVSDNGAGVSASRLVELRECLLHDQGWPLSSNSGVGLHNIHRRLAIKYGALAGLRIECPGQGTVVTIVLPLEAN